MCDHCSHEDKRPGDLKGLGEEHKRLSKEMVDCLVDALDKKKCHVVIDGFAATITVDIGSNTPRDQMRFTIWLANGRECVRSYEDQPNQFGLFFDEEMQTKIWDALAPYREVHEHNKITIEPKTETENTESEP